MGIVSISLTETRRIRQRRDPNAECWKPGNDVPVFLASSGAAPALVAGLDDLVTVGEPTEWVGAEDIAVVGVLVAAGDHQEAEARQRRR